MRRTLVGLLLLSAPALAGGGPENVLVVVNDLNADSAVIARYYIQKRDVPRHHVVHVRIPGPFETFAAYHALLEQPVERWLAAHPQARITTIALTRGIPVTAPAPNDAKFRRGTAHMLAMLAAPDDLRNAKEQLEFRPNPVYRSDASIDPREPVSEGSPIHAVGMLDAFTVEDVKRMIDLSIASDAKRPEGTVYLGRSKEGDPRGMYNGAFTRLAATVEENGLKAAIVEHNPNSILLDGKADVAYFAFGQANWDAAFPAKNTYLPGAVIDNLTSVALTSAAFDPAGKGGQTPMTHFAAAGATVIHGCVLEPTTAAWDREYLHVRRYVEGYAVLESFYMGHPVMPWMNLVAGDPLTQPFARRPVVTLDSFEKVLPAVAGARPSFKLSVSAKATRPDAGIKTMRLYVDGVPAGTSATGEFELREFDPAVNAWRVVAEDDSRFRTQGSAASEPLKRDVGRVSVSFDRVSKGVATFKVTSDKEPVVTWACLTAKDRTATRRGRTFTVALEGDGPHGVDVWIRNAKEGVPSCFTLEVPAPKK